MAASVRVEDDAFKDTRFAVLAVLVGLPDADCARGKMLLLWRQCTAQGIHVLSEQTVSVILGENGPSALVSCDLGEKVDGGIRIKGTTGRIEWLQKLKKNGKKGGRAKARNGRKQLPSNSLANAKQLPSNSLAPQEQEQEQEQEDLLWSGSESGSSPEPPGDLVLEPPGSKPTRVKRPPFRKPEIPIPDDWQPNDAHREHAARLGIDCDQEAERFRNWAIAGDKRYVNWNAGFSTRLGNIPKYQARNGSPVRQETGLEYALRIAKGG